MTLSPRKNLFISSANDSPKAAHGNMYAHLAHESVLVDSPARLAVCVAESLGPHLFLESSVSRAA